MQFNPDIVGTPGTTGHETIGSTATELPDSYKYSSGQTADNKAKTVLIYVESASIRIAFDSAPVPGTPMGYPLIAGDMLLLEGWNEINTVQLIREDSTDADITITSFF